MHFDTLYAIFIATFMPGNDELTIEFYNFFWSEIGTFLVDSLNYSYFHGELSNSQKQAVITLIEEKDKDRRWIKNWRPISLVNVDVKIGSKAIAKRPENLLPHITDSLWSECFCERTNHF